MEVPVVALRVEMGDAGGEFDGREDAAAVEAALLGSGLLSGVGERLDGRGRVLGDGS